MGAGARHGGRAYSCAMKPLFATQAPSAPTHPFGCAAPQVQEAQGHLPGCGRGAGPGGESADSFLGGRHGAQPVLLLPQFCQAHSGLWQAHEPVLMRPMPTGAIFLCGFRAGLATGSQLPCQANNHPSLPPPPLADLAVRVLAGSAGGCGGCGLHVAHAAGGGLQHGAADVLHAGALAGGCCCWGERGQGKTGRSLLSGAVQCGLVRCTWCGAALGRL